MNQLVVVSHLDPESDDSALATAAAGGRLSKATGLSLAHYDTMCVAIANAHRFDDVKTIRDQALAMRIYFAQAKNRESERMAAEIRLRAERRAGELLAEMNLRGAGARAAHGAKSHGADVDVAPPTLTQMGITRDQSRKWQALARVPTDEFETALKDAAAPTTNAILESSGQITQYRYRKERAPSVRQSYYPQPIVDPSEVERCANILRQTAEDRCCDLEIPPEAKRESQVSDEALTLSYWLANLERTFVAPKIAPADVLATMTSTMRTEVKKRAANAVEWLRQIT